jgi:hypothetical protein
VGKTGFYQRVDAATACLALQFNHGIVMGELSQNSKKNPLYPVFGVAAVFHHRPEDPGLYCSH